MIGVFDSGYGGLNILKSVFWRLPEYDYLYLADNVRAPYGARSYNVIYQFTLQGVERLFALGCPLVLLACNTASARALRSLQQHYLPSHFAYRAETALAQIAREKMHRSMMPAHSFDNSSAPKSI
jgi:glutamate racemase